MRVYTHFDNTSSESGLKNDEIANRVRDQPDKVNVKQLGAPALAVFDVDQQAVLLRLSLPDDRRKEPSEKLPAGEPAPVDPPLLELRLGPEPLQP